MKPAVAAALVPFNTPLEGCILWPYQDILGLVTVGIGCLCDSEHAALELEWEPNTPRADIPAQWRHVKAYPKGLHWRRYEAASSLRLTQAGVEHLVHSRAAQFEVELLKHFPRWDSFPADAQLCIMSMAWAMGPAFSRKFPNFTRLANAGAWKACVAECGIRSAGNPGVIPRNALNRMLLDNAWTSAQRGVDPAILHWPNLPQLPSDSGWTLRAEAEAAMAKHETENG